MGDTEKSSPRVALFWIIGIAIVAFIILILAIIFNAIPSSTISGSSQTSATQSLLTQSTATLTPVGEGITSNTITRKNQTWLEFDGDGDYVNIGNTSTFDFDNDTSFTLSGWANFSDITTGNFIFSKGKENNEYKYELRLRNDALSFILYENGTVSDSYCGVAQGTLPFSNDDRIFVVGRYEKDVGCFLYINNTLQNSDTTFSGIIRQTTTQNLTMGERAGEYFNGTLDDLKIYDYSLSNSQLSELYHKSSYGDQLQTIPVLMYHVIDDGSIAEEINVTQFREQMDYLNDSGFETITDVEYYNWTIDGGFDMPEKPIMFIWDDGHISQLVNASPVMAEYGYRGVAAVYTEAIGSGGSSMSWENVSELQNTYNWSIASHSVNHIKFATTPNSEESIQNNMSQSYIDILGNISVAPITWIHPFNNWNTTTMDLCKNNYTLCFGDAPNFGSEVFIYKDSNFTDGSLQRINVRNITTITEYSEGLNFTINNTLGHWKLNENQGTTAYDTSGNGNNGTISGATWNNDGIDVTLTEDTDYSITSAGLFTLIDTSLQWTGINASWGYSSSEDLRADLESIKGNTTLSFVNLSGQFPTIGTIIGILILLTILIGLLIFVILKMMGVTGNVNIKNGSSKFRGSRRNFG